MSRKKFKVQTTLLLDCKKRNDGKIFYSSAKLVARNSDSDEEFKSMHQSIMTKIKNCANKDWIFINAITKHSIQSFEC